MKSLNSLLKLFIEQKIAFVVVGGFAGVLHGSAMVTQDLDLCILLDSSTIEKLRNILKDLNPKHRMTPKKLSFLEVPEDISQTHSLYLQTDWGAIDLISSITGVGDFSLVSQNAITVELFGVSCKVISLEDLILAKKAMGRPKDIAMIKELRIISAKKTK